MLYLVHTQVHIPAGLDAALVERLKTDETALSRKLQEEGKCRHLWRATGQFANYSVFDVSSHDELHTLLMSLPLRPFMTCVQITPLSQHPSAIAQN
jgi:muconolactone D-isomerase